MTTAPPPPLNFPNIQGDIILGIPKKVEEYVFFQITNVPLFRKQLKHLVPLITTTAQVIEFEAQIAAHKSSIAAGTTAADALLPIAGTNVAFSNIGLKKFNITDGLGDSTFAAGQIADAPALGDIINPTTSQPAWDSTFLQPNGLDGVLLITGETELSLQTRKLAVEALLAGSIKIIDTLAGNVRPKPENGHEHFGFQDGISQPAIKGFGKPNNGQEAVDAGIILVGGFNDPLNRPSTVGTDGSFLVFRKLKQYVPEFDAFLLKNGTGFDGLSPRAGADFLGARLVGRWKSGAPIDLAPLQDNLTIAKDPEQNNNFSFTLTNPDDATDQTRCPFSAHIRKTNPRGDLEKANPPRSVDPQRIIRQGIPYGPEVTPEEHAKNTTLKERGLAFVCYQSSIFNGFRFLQSFWANNPDFHVPNVGEDPIIGVNTQGVNGDRTRSVFGFDPKNPPNHLTISKDFIEARGGEYFFSPSIATLRDVIGTN